MQAALAFELLTQKKHQMMMQDESNFPLNDNYNTLKSNRNKKKDKLKVIFQGCQSSNYRQFSQEKLLLLPAKQHSAEHRLKRTTKPQRKTPLVFKKFSVEQRKLVKIQSNPSQGKLLRLQPKTESSKKTTNLLDIFQETHGQGDFELG